MAELKPVRIGNDVHLGVTLTDNSVKVDWSSLTIEQVYMYSDDQKAFGGKCTWGVNSTDPTILNVLFPASEQVYLGTYRVVARVKMKGNENTYDALAINVVSTTAEVTGVASSDETIAVGIEVTEVDTTILYEILRACQAATDSANSTDAEVKAAELLRVSAENARVAAEDARKAAETNRSDAETARSTAESERVAAENTRAANESARKTAEDNRSSAESDRQAAEIARANEENERNTSEDARKSAENTRNTDELARKSAENARNSAESDRKTAELARSSAESSRSTAETARASAETTRKSNETTRQSNEAARVTAEAGRQAELDAKADKTYVDGDKMDVTAHAITALQSQIEALQLKIAEITSGQVVIPALMTDRLTSVSDNMHISGSGAPTVPPDYLYQEYIDTVAKVVYMAYGNTAVSDWKLI